MQGKKRDFQMQFGTKRAFASTKRSLQGQLGEEERLQQPITLSELKYTGLWSAVLKPFLSKAAVVNIFISIMEKWKK